ncbi:p-hydroxybenzoic acid efflux pump subunit AaeA [Mangrovibacter plantisponsor]
MLLRAAITLTISLVALIAVYKTWIFYTKSPWTRDAYFAADIVSVSPDVSGLINDVYVHDNQMVKEGDILYSVDASRYTQALKQAQSTSAYYAAIMAEKRHEFARREKLGTSILSREALDKALSEALSSEYHWAKSVAVKNLAKIDLERTLIRAPADGWITNLNIYKGEYIHRGKKGVTLVKKCSFYVIAYLEETKFDAIMPGAEALITPLGSAVTLSGVVDSYAAGVTTINLGADTKGISEVNSNLEWVRLAQRIPIRIRLNKDPGNTFPAGTTATVVFNENKGLQPGYSLSLTSFLKRLHEFG